MEVVLGLVPGLDGCWALDRFTDAHHGPTSTAMSVGRARALPARGDARVADELARGMADVVQRRRLPRDVVVAAVPSANPLSADLPPVWPTCSDARRRRCSVCVRGGSASSTVRCGAASR
ncbi:MAG: hypothetical protein R2713_13720 [Ilumatobacteraceae bacterium]